VLLEIGNRPCCRTKSKDLSYSAGRAGSGVAHSKNDAQHRTSKAKETGVPIVTPGRGFLRRGVGESVEKNVYKHATNVEKTDAVQSFYFSKKGTHCDRL